MWVNTHPHAHIQYCGPVIRSAWRAWYCISVVCVWLGTKRNKRDYERVSIISSSLASCTQLSKTVSPLLCGFSKEKTSWNNVFLRKQCSMAKPIQPEVPVKTTRVHANEMWNLACFYSLGYLYISLSQIFNLVYEVLCCAKRNSNVVQWTQRTVPNVTKTKELWRHKTRHVPSPSRNTTLCVSSILQSTFKDNQKLISEFSTFLSWTCLVICDLSCWSENLLALKAFYLVDACSYQAVGLPLQL